MKTNVTMKTNFIKQAGICFISLLVCACSSNSGLKSDSHHIINFGSDKGKDVNLSEYVSDIQYIPIETKEDFLLSDIWQIAVSDDYMYVTCESTQNIFQLSGDGKLVKKIGVRGRARNEYAAVRSSYANNSSFFVEFGRKIISYSPQTGEIQQILEPSDINLNLFGNVIFQDNGSFAIMNSQENSNCLYVFDKELNKTDSLILFNTEEKLIETQFSSNNIVVEGGGKVPENQVFKTQLMWRYSPAVYKFNDTFRIISPFMDTLLAYKDGKLSQFAVMDYGDITAEQRFAPTLNGELAVDTRTIMESDNILIFSTYSDDKFIYNKATGETIKSKDGFINDIDGGENFWPLKISGNKMYQFMSADLFIEAAAQSNSSQMKKVADSITDQSNPVIVIATLK